MATQRLTQRSLKFIRWLRVQLFRHPPDGPPWDVLRTLFAHLCTQVWTPFATYLLARQREQPTGGTGTAKGAARLARHVPGRARNEPLRADAVTGQTSDRR